MSFRIVTFNMQNGQPWSDTDPFPPRIDLDGVAAFLQGLNADILCLQEVEQGFDGGEQIEPPPHYSRLKEILSGYDSVFGYPLKNPTEIPFGLGLAIFSKTQLKNFYKVDLPAADVEFEFEGKICRASSRLLLEVGTSISGRAIKLLNTHLQAFFMIGQTSDAHPQQRNHVVARLRELGGLPLILAGDMNSAPDESLVAQFEGAGFRAVQNEVVTWRRMPFVTDHLFFNSALRLESYRIVETDVSDHHALVADFEFL